MVYLSKGLDMATKEFDEMLLNNADFLKPFAVNLTKDPEEAKDLYQETLYKALSNKAKYNIGTNIKACLFTIMRNIFINESRKKAKQQVVPDSTPNDHVRNAKPASIYNNAESEL